MASHSTQDRHPDLGGVLDHNSEADVYPFYDMDIHSVTEGGSNGTSETFSTEQPTTVRSYFLAFAARTASFFSSLCLDLSSNVSSVQYMYEHQPPVTIQSHVPQIASQTESLNLESASSWVSIDLNTEHNLQIHAQDGHSSVILDNKTSQPSSDTNPDSDYNSDSFWDGRLDSDLDCVSETSTVSWSKESFAAFKLRVLEFACDSIWPDAAAEDIIVERLRGGGFNHIIGLTRHFPNDSGKDISYILRIPRLANEATQIDRDVAALLFVQRHTDIPVTSVVAYDETDSNKLGCPYMIQKRAAGRNLLFSWRGLDHDQKCRFARELGTVYCQMLSVRSKNAGVLAFSENDKTLKASLEIAALGSGKLLMASTGTLVESPADLPEYLRVITLYDNTPAVQSITELVTPYFQAQKAASLEGSSNLVDPMLTDAFCKMACELEAGGWFDDIPNALAHLDLFPRNVLIHPDSENSQPILSCIMDWDSAILAPAFMTCVPPKWIWAWDDGEDETPLAADYVPATPEECQLKQLFEEAAGPLYMRFAYEPAYRLARRLLRLAFEHGIRNDDGESFKEAKDMLEEWETIREQ
ncbi:hypothetical protein G7046_g4348 [Stylonectria norvegica]|nr:hypothetical protein G7046_g4348 [Stylonectria norvegica]